LRAVTGPFSPARGTAGELASNAGQAGGQTDAKKTDGDEPRWPDLHNHPRVLGNPIA